MIPYYLQIGLNERVGSLGIEKEDGIPTLSAVLGLINISIFEEGKISGIDGLKDKGFPALCGLGNLPDPSFFYRFLQGVKTRGAQEFIIECSKKFVETGLNIGRVVNLDGKFLAYFGKKKISKTMHPTRNKVLPGLNVFAVQDQETRNPIFLMVKYPGLKPIDIGIPLLEKTMGIVGKEDLEKVIWDRWFSVGALLDYLDKHMKLKYVTIMRMHKNRIQEMKKIPVSKFRTMADGRQVAFKNTNLRNYEGKVKLIVICFEEDEEEKYYGYLTNDTISVEETIIEEYDHRWRIECCMHLSAFTIEGTRYSSSPMGDYDEKCMDVTLGDVLCPGMKFYYEYDFGTTTEITLKVVSEIEGEAKSKSVQLMARNDPPAIICASCGKIATQVCSQCIWSGEAWYCDKCSLEHECDEDMFLPVVNSPRVGMCGYTGTA